VSGPAPPPTHTDLLRIVLRRRGRDGRSLVAFDRIVVRRWCELAPGVYRLVGIRPAEAADLFE
jgi:hypothetical protein